MAQNDGAEIVHLDHKGGLVLQKRRYGAAVRVFAMPRTAVSASRWKNSMTTPITNQARPTELTAALPRHRERR